MLALGSRIRSVNFTMTGKIVVFCTCASMEEARKLAGVLLEERLAACVNVIGGITSHYRWQGSLESAEEFLLVIKSSQALFPQLRAAIEQAHSYEVPEVLALPVLDGAPNYLQWMDDNLRRENQ